MGEEAVMALKKIKSDEKIWQVRKQYICILPDPISPEITDPHSTMAMNI